MQFAVIDLGVGNLRSVAQAFKHVAPNADVIITGDAQVISNADKVILPGQGAIGTWFNEVAERELLTVIKQVISEKPLLGICVGMQALFRHCEEDGGINGLGIFDGTVRHFSDFHDASGLATQLKIPHMGWNQVTQNQFHPLWKGVSDQAYFYFVHSFCANLAATAESSVVYGSADYGHEFIAAVGLKNLFAVQFHPEKSHQDGLQLLKNFVQWDGAV